MSRNLALRPGKRLGLLALACMLVIALGQARDASAFVRVSARVDFHTGGYDLLSQYGDWVRVHPYGVVWCPYVDYDWAPFYDGRWIWTRGGWAWDSYEPFGELVYHYGYWYFDRDIGWFWVPGYEWSPARVQWYTYGSYCGWAPMPPPNYYWPDPWDFYDINIWVVVHIDNFYCDHIGRHGIDRPHYRNVFRREGVVKRAPEVRQVETVARRRIPVETIERRPMDIRTDKIKVAERPAIRRDAQARNVKARETAPAQRDVRDNKRIAAPSQQRVVTPSKDVKARREIAAPETRARVAAPSRNTGVERKAVESKAAERKAVESRSVERKAAERTVAIAKQSVRPERQIAKTTVSRQSERQVAATRASSQPQRRTAAPKQNERAAREKVEKKK